MKLAEFFAKTDHVLSPFRSSVAMACTIVALAGTVIVAGNPPSKPLLSTPRVNPGSTEEAAVAPAGDTPGIDSPTSSAPAAKASGKGQVLVTKGGVTVRTAPDGIPVADLFTAAEDRIGLSDTGGLFGKGQITLCGHAATTFGPAFNTSKEDLDVYWQMVNDTGGVHGRNIVTSWENDNYDPATAETAATACKQKYPFILLGGIGFEQIPTVRNYAERNHMFYIHHIAVSDPSKKYSFAPLPTVERLGAFAGDWVRRKFPNTKVGIIYRDSEFWLPGVREFKKALGRAPVAEEGVIKNQGSYHAQILEMQSSGADLVFTWENALAQTAMINEADGFVPPYRPQWIVFPFNLITDTLGDRALNPALQGISAWVSYSPGGVANRSDNGTDPYAEYAAEVTRFEAAYRKYRDVPTTDIHWMVWLAWRSTHYTLELCGRECTRNKVLGQMIAKPFDYSLTAPSCPLDYTRNGHEGGYWASMFETYRRADGSVGWKHIQHCKDAWS